MTIRVNSKRIQLLASIQKAAYDNDSRKLARLFCENRVSRAVFEREAHLGRLARQCDDLTTQRNGVAND